MTLLFLILLDDHGIDLCCLTGYDVIDYDYIDYVGIGYDCLIAMGLCMLVLLVMMRFDDDAF